MRTILGGLCLLLLLAPRTGYAAFRQVDGGIEFSYTDPSAGSVSLAGDFNEWDPNATPMSDPDGDGTWTTVVSLSAGRHEYKFVVSGGTWVADPGNPVTGGDYGNSIIVIAGDGSIQRTEVTPAAPSGTPALSNTPVHSRVYLGGWFRTQMRAASDVEGDPRLRLQRPDNQFNLDVTANVNDKVWGTARLQVRTGRDGANELSTELYKAQGNFLEDDWQVKAWYNDEVFNSNDPFKLIGHYDLRGTIEIEERPFGQGQQGIFFRAQPFGSSFNLTYSDTFDEDIFNPRVPTQLDPRVEGLNQNTGTDVLGGRWTLPVGPTQIGVTYRGEYSDWWVNFDLEGNNYPDEIEAHRQERIDAGLDPNQDQVSFAYELDNSRHTTALDVELPVADALNVNVAGAWVWYQARWAVGNREKLQGGGQGSTFVNGTVDLPIGSEVGYRGRAGLEFDPEERPFTLGLAHEIGYGQGMGAEENAVAYRTQPGSMVSDRDIFAQNQILTTYFDVNGTSSLNILRLGPNPRRVIHSTEFDGEFRFSSLALELEADRHDADLEYSDFFQEGERDFTRELWRLSPRLRWRPFEAQRYHLSLETQFLRWDQDVGFSSRGLPPPQTADEASGGAVAQQPAKGLGSMTGLDSSEYIVSGLVPLAKIIRRNLDLRFDLRWIDFSGTDELQQVVNELPPENFARGADLGGTYFAPFAALVYSPTRNIEIQVGYGVDPSYYFVIDPEGWGNGRQQFRDEYLIDQRLDPYNPINVVLAEKALEDRQQIVINALISF